MAYKASLQKIPQAGAYQDPNLEMGFFLEPMDIIGGKQVAEFKLMQMFPWFGTKKSCTNGGCSYGQNVFRKIQGNKR